MKLSKETVEAIGRLLDIAQRDNWPRETRLAMVRILLEADGQ